MIKPILIEQEIPEIGNLCLSPRYKDKLMVFGEFENSYPDECIKVDIILIDTEAKIVEGNWFMGKEKPFKAFGAKELDPDFGKIISSTNNTHNLPQLSPQSIQLLISYYNEFKCMPESVDVEEMDDYKNYPKSKIRPNQQGEIDITIPEVEETNLDIELKAYGIPKIVWEESQKIAEYHDKCMEVEEKTYTEEEVLEWIFRSYNLRSLDGVVRPSNQLKDWFELNKKK